MNSLNLPSKSGLLSFNFAKSFWVESSVILLLALFLLLPGRLTPLAWYPYGIGLLLLCGIVHRFAHKDCWLRTPLDWPVALLLFWLPVNYWASIDKEQSWEAIGYLLFGVTCYRAFIQWQPFWQAPQRLLYLFLLSELGLALLGPLLLIADPSFLPFSPLLQFTPLLQFAAMLAETINPNVLAGALVLLLPLHTAVILPNCWSRHRALKFALVIVWLIMIGLLFITQSRGALLAVAIAVLLVITIYYSKTYWLAPMLVVAVAGSMVWIGPRQLLDGLVLGSALGGLDGRMEIWSRALYALHDFPFTGIGIGTFNRVIPLLYPYFLWTPDQEIPHAHNLFLQIGVDLGLVGLIAQIALWINLFRMLHTLLRQNKNFSTRTIAAGAFGSLLAMLLHGLVDAVTWGNKLAFLPWWLYALITLLFLHYWREEHSIKV